MSSVSVIINKAFAKGAITEDEFKKVDKAWKELKRLQSMDSHTTVVTIDDDKFAYYENGNNRTIVDPHMDFNTIDTPMSKKDVEKWAKNWRINASKNGLWF